MNTLESIRESLNEEEKEMLRKLEIRSAELRRQGVGVVVVDPVAAQARSEERTKIIKNMNDILDKISNKNQ